MNRDECGLAFYDEKRFTFYQRRFDVSENFIIAEARSAGREQLRAVDPTSLQHFFTAFYDNFIYRPLKSLGKFIIVTKTIFWTPSVKLDARYLSA